MFNPNTLLKDKDIARFISMSPSWVRKQRHLRKHGQPHTLTIDPIMVGTCPRYKAEDIQCWLFSLEGGA